MGAWISAPGTNASGETGKFLLNSDYDHLLIHASGTASIASSFSGVVWTIPETTHFFPALPHPPVVLLFQNRPFVSAPNEFTQAQQCFIYNDRIVLPARSVVGNFGSQPPNWRFSWIVFKNALGVS